MLVDLQGMSQPEAKMCEGAFTIGELAIVLSLRLTYYGTHHVLIKWGHWAQTFRRRERNLNLAMCLLGILQ